MNNHPKLFYLYVALCLVTAISAIAIGFWQGTLKEPQIVEIRVPVPVVETVIEYRDVIDEVRVPHYIDVLVEKWRQIFPRQFDSVEQFETWYEEQNFTILMPSGVYTVDCDDYAAWVQTTALKQGYKVSQALALNGKYYEIKVTDTKDGHAGNLVLINGIYYWVEPQPDKFEIIEICPRD